MTNFVSLLFYLALACLSAFFAGAAKRKNKKALLAVPIGLLSVVSGLRADSVGVDTAAYKASFSAFLHSGAVYVNREYLFYKTSAVLLNIFNNYHAVFFTWAVLTIALFFSVLWQNRASIDISLAAFLFTVFYYGGTMNGMRQYIAIAIVLWASRFLQKREYPKFFFAVAAAALFHRSAIAALLCPIVVIGLRQAYQIRELLALFLSVTAGLIAAPFVLMEYAGYTSRMKQVDIGLMMVVRLAVYLFAYAVYQHSRSRAASAPEPQTAAAMSEDEFFDKAAALALLGHLLAFGSAFIEYASRAGYYFRVFELLFYGRFFLADTVGKKLKIVLLVILALLGAYSLWRYNGIIPYALAR